MNIFILRPLFFCALASTFIASCGEGKSSEGGLFDVENPGSGSTPIATPAPQTPQPTTSPSPATPSPTATPGPTPVPTTPTPTPATPTPTTPTPTPSPNTPTPTPPPVEKPEISIRTSDPEAFEANNDLAKFVVERDTVDGALDVRFTLGGAISVADGSASPSDYRLAYSDGGEVGEQITFNNNQNQRIIEVQAVNDDLFEVPETLSISIDAHTSYELSGDSKAEITINDAPNTAQYSKVFIGIFSPQGDAVTSATGTMSLILRGDNKQAVLSYNFFNLSSEQTDQHIHLSPSGTVIRDVEISGPVSGMTWDLTPGGIFVTRQQMLDSLFAGELYLNIHTSNFPAGEITASLIYDEAVQPPEQTPLTAEDVDRDIIRFLSQATFGASPDSYNRLRAQIEPDGSNRMQVYNAWLEAQFATPQSSLLELTDASKEIFSTNNGWQDRRDAFWTMAVFSKDQLRQRVAFALSEILVIGDDLNKIRSAYRGAADYWDTLGENSFGTYRKALEDASRHTIMGVWLSHLRNRKADPTRGFFPDENYAREIMQLFSFGLVQRQSNGAIKLGNDNLPIATYDNDVIQQMARVFTGLGMSAREDSGELIENNRFTLGDTVNDYQYRWTEPMKFFPEHHEFGEKVLFSDKGSRLVIPENSQETEAAADAELAQVLDNIVGHSTTAPYISRILIQRLVTSNPSADYIARVSAAFGEDGDMKAVIKAILLDSEARNPGVANSTSFGKVKEPILRITNLLRLLDGGSDIALDDSTNGLDLPFANHYERFATILRIGDIDIGQHALGSPTVFNFFSPDYAPTGELALNSLVAPELEINTESRMFATLNIMDRLLARGFVRSNADDNVSYTLDQLRVEISYSQLDDIWNSTAGSDQDKATAVVDFLDFYLNSGQLKAQDDTDTRAIIIDIVRDANVNQRFNLAVYGMINSPAVVVQK